MYKPAEPKRRQFFKIATAGTVATAAGGLPMMFVPNAALAEEVLGSDTFTTLVKIARDIFPHDRFEDALYANAVGVYAEQAKSDEGIKKLIQEGVSQADTIALAKFGSTYMQVANERDRVHVLQSIETSPFFKKIRGDLVVSLYNQPAVWAKLGYQGPSAPFGGYIKRGFNDQNWMDHL
jgi:hypothetical protein